MRNEIKGLLAALLGFGMWGIVPIFWRLYREYSTLDLLAHRVLWSFVILTIGILVFQKGRVGYLFTVSKNKLCLLFLTSLLIFSNWYLFVLSIQLSAVTSASLGYYLNPFFNAALGVLLLREKLDYLKSIGLGLAAIGVGYAALEADGLVFIVVLGLPVTFSLYGFLRKKLELRVDVGLWWETLFGLPLAALIWSFTSASWQGFLHQPDWKFGLFLLGTGIVTLIPLYFFNVAVNHLPYVTVGMLQYLAPSLQLLTGVFLFGEPFDEKRMILFVCVWGAVMFSVLSLLRTYYRSQQRVA